MFDFLKAERPEPPPRDRIEPRIGNLTEFHDVPSSDAVRMGQIFGSLPTAAGAIVTEQTAMRVSAVYACVRLIAGAIATLPLPIYRRTDEGRERAKHPYWWLLNEQPTPRFTAASFWEFITAQMLLRGDGIAYIARPTNNSPGVRSLIPVRRQNVNIFRMDDRLRYTITDVINGEPGQFTVDQDDVLHFPGCGFDGLCSMSVIGWAARQAIGIALKADEHAGQFFGSGAHIQYAVKTPKEMTTKQQDAFREAWVAKYSGAGVSNVPLVLTEGLEVQELSMTAQDAQLLESRRFQVVDIARAFGVPPHMIGETSASTSWGSGIEQMSIGFVKYTLQPHLTRFEQELNRKLFPRAETFFVEFNVDGQLAGDSKTQADVLAKALGGPGTQGYMTVNEARRLKNMPPVEGGDQIVFAGSQPATDPTSDPATEPADPTPPAKP